MSCGLNCGDTTTRPLRVLALTRKANSPSFERRVLSYIEPLSRHGIVVDWRRIPNGFLWQHGLGRLARQYDCLWWQRYLPNPLKAILWRRVAKRIVFDFDDPIIYSTHGGKRPAFMRTLKFGSLLRRCDAAVAASATLADMARKYCPNSVVLPMSVELPDVPPRTALGVSAPVQLLWLGSRSTLKFLRPLLPALDALARRRPQIRLRLVAHERVDAGRMAVDFRPWSPREQDSALRECDIGLCPMPDTPWTRGKCPYKVIQYMAWRMPWVGSAVGENLVAAGLAEAPRGLCAASEEQWLASIECICDDGDLSRQMGDRGRAYVEQNHDHAKLTLRLVEIFRNVVNGT